MLKAFVLMLSLVLVSGSVWAKEDCYEVPKGYRFLNVSDIQQCRIANALEDIAAALRRDGF